MPQYQKFKFLSEQIASGKIKKIKDNSEIPETLKSALKEISVPENLAESKIHWHNKLVFRNSFFYRLISLVPPAGVYLAAGYLGGIVQYGMQRAELLNRENAIISLTGSLLTAAAVSVWNKNRLTRNNKDLSIIFDRAYRQAYQKEHHHLPEPEDLATKGLEDAVKAL